MNESEKPEYKIKTPRHRMSSDINIIRENTLSQVSVNFLNKIKSEENEFLQLQNEEDPINVFEKQFQVFYINLIEMYQKNQYRKLLLRIQQKEEIFKQSPHYWKINHLKITSILNLLERKFIKYYSEKSLRGISTFFYLLEIEICNWIKGLHDLQKEFENNNNNNTSSISSELGSNPYSEFFEERVELVITFLLAQCYYFARFCLHQNLITDCISFLALGEKLIKTTSDYYVSPETARYSRLIFSFLTSLLITDENYDSAKNYISTVLKIAYKELELRLKGELRFLICLEDYNKLEKENLYDVLLSISIAFFHLGVCYEQECELEKSYQAYKQARWFGEFCKIKKVTAFTDILYDIEHRAQIRSELVSFLHREEANIPLTPVKEKKKPKVIYDEEEKQKKFDQIKEFISKLPLTEIDDDEVDLLNEVNKKPFSKRVGTITKTIHVLNYLMGEQFRNVINKMNKIEINLLDKETKRAIQKRIIFLKNSERMKLLEKSKELKKKQEQKIKQNEQIETTEFVSKEYEEDRKHYKHKKRLKSLPKSALSRNMSPKKQSLYYTTTETYQQTAPTTISHFSFKNTIQHKPPSSRCPIKLSKSQQTKLNKVPKIKHNKFTFNPKFQRKITFLDNQLDKEIKFQKNLLKCKDQEKGISFEPFNDRKVQTQCENFFMTTLEKEMKGIREREKMLEKNELNKKALSVSKKMKQAFTSKYVREKNKSVIPKPKYSDYQIEKCNQRNNTLLNTFQGDLDLIEQKELLCENKLKKLKHQRIRKKKIYD